MVGVGLAPSTMLIDSIATSSLEQSDEIFSYAECSRDVDGLWYSATSKTRIKARSPLGRFRSFMALKLSVIV